MYIYKEKYLKYKKKYINLKNMLGSGRDDIPLVPICPICRHRHIMTNTCSICGHIYEIDNRKIKKDLNFLNEFSKSLTNKNIYNGIDTITLESIPYYNSILNNIKSISEESNKLVEDILKDLNNRFTYINDTIKSIKEYLDDEKNEKNEQKLKEFKLNEKKNIKEIKKICQKNLRDGKYECDKPMREYKIDLDKKIKELKDQTIRSLEDYTPDETIDLDQLKKVIVDIIEILKPINKEFILESYNLYKTYK